MDLAPIQHQQASAIWARLGLSIKGKGEHDPVSSSKNAFIALGLINIPVPVAYYLIKQRATRRAILEWPETWNARWIAPFFPDKKDSLLAEHISIRVKDALQNFTSMLVLSPLTRRGRWWTMITANFTHFKLSHLVGNMLGLNAVGPACAEVPGMTPLHVCGIALTTSLATGFQALHRFPDSWAYTWSMCGFSAVLCAFTSVAALGAPQAEPDVFGKYPVKAQRVWTVAGMQILSDVIALIRAKNGTGGGVRSGRMESVDYVAHLVGYACGAAYYIIFLWNQNDSHDADNDEQPVDVMKELPKSRDQPAPVRESEDWKEMASKLGYSAADE